MNTKILGQINGFGQSIWLDGISRSQMEQGGLTEIINAGVSGMTTNPKIFYNEIRDEELYSTDIKALAQKGLDAVAVCDEIIIEQVARAAKLFKAVYDERQGKDGYVSIEINPLLANDTGKSIAKGKELFKRVAMPNVMIKVPATASGFPVITELVASGINVNVTLIFSVEQYISAAKAYLSGIKELLQRGGAPEYVHSVASVFVSRIDSAVDAFVTQKGIDTDFLGKYAVINAKKIYKEFENIFASAEYAALRAVGANVQRVLWASTSTKNPEYDPLKYIKELIFGSTVNTVPLKTLLMLLNEEATAAASPRISADEKIAMNEIERHTVEINDLLGKLLKAGVKDFEESFISLKQVIKEKM